jgi:hypothetical protein
MWFAADYQYESTATNFRKNPGAGMFIRFSNNFSIPARSQGHFSRHAPQQSIALIIAVILTYSSILGRIVDLSCEWAHVQHIQILGQTNQF